MVKLLRDYIEKQKFNPDLLGLIINPFFIVRRGLFKNLRDLSSQVHGELLDVGCGKKPYRQLFKVKTYVGIDIENPGHDHSNEDIDIFYDGQTFPFPDESFDSVLSSEVLEHVFNPERFLAEINRVLRTGGTILITAPFLWDEHEQPLDYARYSSFGIKSLLERSGFHILKNAKSVSDFRAIVQLTALYIYKKFYSSNRTLNAALTAIFIFPITIVGLVVSAVIPSNRDLYLNNVVLARKVKSVFNNKEK